jgi:hypothetical protein
MQPKKDYRHGSRSANWILKRLLQAEVSGGFLGKARSSDSSRSPLLKLPETVNLTPYPIPHAMI